MKKTVRNRKFAFKLSEYVAGLHWCLIKSISVGRAFCLPAQRLCLYLTSQMKCIYTMQDRLSLLDAIQYRYKLSKYSQVYFMIFAIHWLIIKNIIVANINQSKLKILIGGVLLMELFSVWTTKADLVCHLKCT